MNMKLSEWFSSQLEREAAKTRKALERMPEGRDDWKPHPRSMEMGRLAMLVATMPTWIPLVIGRDDLDLKPAGGSNFSQQPLRTPAELAGAHDKGVTEALAALRGASEEHLHRPWRLLVAGTVVSEDPRYVVLRDTMMHWAHHRGQLTVYLRMNGASVPAIYGPSADENSFD